MRNKPLTFTLHIGGKQVETLTEEQRQKMADRLSEAMSLAYSLDIEEFKKIKTSNEGEKI
jgi:coenzyme F420-reducing hydrogenase alpha subunit